MNATAISNATEITPEMMALVGNDPSFDWDHYHRAQKWVLENHPEQVGEFPECWEQAWAATCE